MIAVKGMFTQRPPVERKDRVCHECVLRCAPTPSVCAVSVSLYVAVSRDLRLRRCCRRPSSCLRSTRHAAYGQSSLERATFSVLYHPDRRSSHPCAVQQLQPWNGKSEQTFRSLPDLEPTFRSVVAPVLLPCRVARKPLLPHGLYSSAVPPKAAADGR